MAARAPTRPAARRHLRAGAPCCGRRATARRPGAPSARHRPPIRLAYRFGEPLIGIARTVTGNTGAGQAGRAHHWRQARARHARGRPIARQMSFPAPNWLKFKRWRARRAPEEAPGAPISAPAYSETNQNEAQPAGGCNKSAPAASRRRPGRRLAFVPRALIGIIERAMSPDAAGRPPAAGARPPPESPLRSFRPRRRRRAGHEQADLEVS